MIVFSVCDINSLTKRCSSSIVLSLETCISKTLYLLWDLREPFSPYHSAQNVSKTLRCLSMQHITHSSRSQYASCRGRHWCVPSCELRNSLSGVQAKFKLRRLYTCVTQLQSWDSKNTEHKILRSCRAWLNLATLHCKLSTSCITWLSYLAVYSNYSSLRNGLRHTQSSFLNKLPCKHIHL